MNVDEKEHHRPQRLQHKQRPPLPQQFMIVMLCLLSATRATLKLILALQRGEGTKICSWLSEHN